MRKLAPALVAAAVLAACGGGDGADGGGGDAKANTGSRPGGLQAPTFAPADGGAPSTSAPSGAATPDPTAPPATSPAGPPAEGATAAPKEEVAFDDRVGDATQGVGVQQPPPWSDLAGGRLERQGNAYRLTVRLGGAAPSAAADGETMNVAGFFDTDGNGEVDRELWANLGPKGWGPVWYDAAGNAAPGERSNVTVLVRGDEVRLLFPDVMLGRPDRLRFSIASEYGPLAAIGSDAARRDDAPDDDRGVSFP